MRWVPLGTVGGETVVPTVPEPQNRPLHVLFMATSPQTVDPVLDYKQGKSAILQAIQRQPLRLEVEESGCLKELGNLVSSYEPDYFDVLTSPDTLL